MEPTVEPERGEQERALALRGAYVSGRLSAHFRLQRKRWQPDSSRRPAAADPAAVRDDGWHH